MSALALAIVPVVGSQRSGTTLMGQLLGAHPQAVLIDEDDGLYEWSSAALGSTRHRRTKRLFERSLRSCRTKYRDPGSRVSRTGRPASAITHAVLKAPNLTFAFDAIAQHWPGTSVVYMHRDIRAVVASTLALSVPVADNQLRMIRASPQLTHLFAGELARLERLGPNAAPHLKMALVAQMKMSLGDRFRERGLHVIDVKYESLVERPADNVLRVLAEAQLEPASECLHHEDILTGLGPGHTMRSRATDDRSVDAWRRYLSDRESREIWHLVGDYMESLGYRPA